MTLTEILTIVVAGLLTNNIVLSQSLGICPFLGVSKKTDSALGMGAAVTFVLLIASVVCWALYNYVLLPLEIEYLQTIVFILIIAVLVQIADTLSAARPGARNDSMENYIKRLEQLENIGNSFEGVDKSYAMQAGREIRVLVKPDEIDDLESFKLARELKSKIESEMQYPGTIKITVVRETRAQEEAR